MNRLNQMTPELKYNCVLIVCVVGMVIFSAWHGINPEGKVYYDTLVNMLILMIRPDHFGSSSFGVGNQQTYQAPSAVRISPSNTQSQQ